MRNRPSQNTGKPIPRGRVAILGMITIAVYGSWFYSFGVLLDPILEDTGWSEPAVAAVFSASSLVAGLGALGGGWLLDRLGSRLVFAAASILGGGSLVVASRATTPVGFAVAGAVGGGVLASLGFYHVTQTAAVRLSPGAEDRAIAVLTIWGAFASVAYIPITAWLVSNIDWRATLSLLGASVSVMLLIGVISIDTRQPQPVIGHRRHLLEDVGRTVTTGRARRFMISQALAGVGVGALLVYQVPAMTASGLALASASFWAGFRGFAQLGGRLPLMPLVRKYGIASSLRIAYGAIGLGALALAFSGNQWLAATYAVLAGFGIGAVSPLVGMHSRTIFGETSLGTAMGLVSLVFQLAAACGPVGAAGVAELSGSRALPVAVSGLIVGAAAFVVRSTD